VEAAFRFFLKLTEAAGYPYFGAWQTNIFRPKGIGRLSPTTLVPATAIADPSAFDDILIAGFRELVDFYPYYVADNLKEQLEQLGVQDGAGRVRAVWTELGLDKGRELNSYDVAVALEDEAIRRRWTESLKASVRPGTLLAVPAVLGLKKWRTVHGDVEARLGVTVLEIPTLPPSVLGIRLAESLMAHLERNGVEFRIGYGATGMAGKDAVYTAVKLETASGRLTVEEAKAFVLATGGILGGGLKVYPDRIEETVLGISVDLPEPVDGYADFFALEGQPLSRAGIRVNGLLQPLSRAGAPLAQNVFVAGRNLAGYDPFVEKDGNGVALVSGYRAGCLAAERGNA